MATKLPMTFYREINKGIRIEDLYDIIAKELDWRIDVTSNYKRRKIKEQFEYEHMLPLKEYKTRRLMYSRFLNRIINPNELRPVTLTSQGDFKASRLTNMPESKNYGWVTEDSTEMKILVVMSIMRNRETNEIKYRLAYTSPAYQKTPLYSEIPPLTDPFYFIMRHHLVLVR